MHFTLLIAQFAGVAEWVHRFESLWWWLGTIFTVVVVVALLVTFRALFIFVVPQGYTGVLLRRGALRHENLKPRWYLKWPLIDSGDKIFTGVQPISFGEKTRTNDNSFVTVRGAVQFRVMPDKAARALFEIDKPNEIIIARVLSAMRSAVSSRNAQECFEHKDAVEQAVLETVRAGLEELGFEIVAIPITDVAPDEEIVTATNRVQLAEKTIAAERANAEAEKIRAGGQAIARAEAAKIAADGQAAAFERQAEGYLNMLRTLSGNPDLEVPLSVAVVIILRIEGLKMRTAFANSGRAASVVLPDDGDLAREIRELLPTLMAHGDVEVEGNDEAPPDLDALLAKHQKQLGAEARAQVEEIIAQLKANAEKVSDAAIASLPGPLRKAAKRFQQRVKPSPTYTADTL